MNEAVKEKLMLPKRGRIVQIQSCMVAVGEVINSTLYALCDNGHVWFRLGRQWKHIDAPPEPAREVPPSADGG